MKKVLIIEDDWDTLELLRIIAKKSNYDVILSSNVLPFTLVEKIKPDLILLDHWVNDQIGSDLCYQIKQNAKTHDIPVIIISAVPGIGKIARESLADGCLEKPFDIEEIEAVLDSY